MQIESEDAEKRGREMEDAKRWGGGGKGRARQTGFDVLLQHAKRSGAARCTHVPNGDQRSPRCYTFKGKFHKFTLTIIYSQYFFVPGMP